MHPDHLLPRHAYLKNDIPVAGVAHQAGTCRFGADPATSVLNTDCRAHEVDNLYVVDTSFFPSIGAVNPALTAMANALRVGDHIARAHRARRSAGGSPRMPPDTANGRRHVVVVGGGFAGVGCAQRLAQAGGRPRHAARPQQLPPVPAAALPGGDLPAGPGRHRLLAAQGLPRARERGRQARGRGRRSTRRRGPSRPPTGGSIRATSWCWPPDRGRTSSARRARRSTRSRSTGWTTRRACARRSSASSRPPTATRS